MKNESGLTSVIGAILMILLVIMLVSIFAVFISGFYHPISKSAFIVPNIQNQSISGKNIISMFNKGGDTAYLVASGSRLYLMSIYVDTPSSSYRALPLPGIDSFGPGTMLYIQQFKWLPDNQQCIRHCQAGCPIRSILTNRHSSG